MPLQKNEELMVELTVDGRRAVDAGQAADRRATAVGAGDHLGLTGTKFGCGMALCGACTVHVDGEPTRACVTPLFRGGRERRSSPSKASARRSRARPCRKPGYR